MKTFLQVIAEQYSARYQDLSDFTFVFPSKRSGTIFQKALLDTFTSGMRLSPEITTISELVTDISGLEIDSRIDLIFTLYNLYRDTLKDLPEDKIPPFEKFTSWGEVALRDFSEADLYGIDAGRLFRNVKEYKSIATSFLSDEQINVLREYFDMSYMPPDIDSFWVKHYPENEEGSMIKKKFRTLWESLGELYERLTLNLESRGLCIPGGAYRKAVEKLIVKGRDISSQRKMVFVGFNVLSKMEFLLFKQIGKLSTKTEYGTEPFADYVWDITGPFLKDSGAGAGFVSRNLKSFPKPSWLDLSESDSDSYPDIIEVIASPSNTLQAKIAGNIAAEWVKNGEVNPSDNNAAIILPDENLLLPLIYSLPDEIENVNLTMGYPLRLTSTMSFVDKLKRMQLRRSSISGQPAFFHEDLMLLLSHPFTTILIGAEGVGKIRNHIRQYRKYAITPEQIESLVPDKNVRLLFRLLSPDTPAKEIIAWLDTLFATISDSLTSSLDNLLLSKIDVSHIAIYRDALRRLEDAITAQNIDLKYFTLLSMADRFLAGETVGFQGEPLEGLQVMGLLETRALDFDHLIITSMNEKIMPRKIRRKSFIPESIRKGFGMPSAGYEESIFAYYFYRLMARARKVTLIYDARTGEGRGGDVSRYILQIRHLHPRAATSRKTFSFGLRQGVAETITIDKDALTRKMLGRLCTQDSGKGLSASTILNYCECPVRFFYRVILELPEQSEPKEFMDELIIGTVYHNVMENIYLSAAEGERETLKGTLIDSPIKIDKEFILQYLNDENKINKLIVRAINSLYHHLGEDRLETPLAGEPALTARKILQWVKSTLKKDSHISPFFIYGIELGDTERIPINDKNGNVRMVNVKYAIDRVDRISSPRGDVWRIIDYKTGKAHLFAKEPDDIFNGAYEAKNILQPILYCYLFNIKINGDVPVMNQTPLRPEIYSMVRNHGKNDNIVTPYINIADFTQEYETEFKLIAEASGMTKEQGERRLFEALERLEAKPASGFGNVNNHLDIMPLFLPRLNSVINEIFDTSVPFISTSNLKSCNYCPYSRICGRGIS